MKYSKAYILFKTKPGKEEEFFNRIKELKLKYYARYRLFGAYDLLIELLYNDWDDLDNFMYNIQQDKKLKSLIIDEIRMISHDKNIEIP
ncbi:MAG: hypothetical protein ACTSVI_16465 [Promethearchaeota archaeon]